AVGLLDQCETHHRDRNETLRELRAVSERAVLRLFYATWFAVGSSAAPLFLADDALHQLEASAADLRRCLALDERARTAAQRDQQRQAFFNRLERQYLTNCAAAEVIADLIARKHGPLGPVRLVDQDSPIAGRILKLARGDGAGRLPVVARTDLSAFLVLRNQDQEAASYLKELAVDRLYRPTLAIDQWLLRTISNVVDDWLSPLRSLQPISRDSLPKS